MNKLDDFRTQLKNSQIDWAVLVPGFNLQYVTGIHSHLSERPFIVLIHPEKTVAFTPLLEADKAKSAGIDHIYTWTDEEGYQNRFMEMAQDLNWHNTIVAVEAGRMRVMEYELVMNHGVNSRIIHLDPILDEMRLRKSADEIAQIQIAVDVAETAYRQLLPTIKVGQTEKEIASRLTQFLLEAGADSMSFDPIVASGENSALPHATPTDRPIQSGDLLILDWGARVGSYVSDITRTIGIGKISPQQQAIYNVVQEANKQGRLASGCNVPPADIDRATRAVVDEAGYGEYFIHRTGHGLGMEVHESPSIVKGVLTPLPEGAVFTIEPGIYHPKIGGVRIEDDMVITAEGAISLTTLSRELFIVPA